MDVSLFKLKKKKFNSTRCLQRGQQCTLLWVSEERDLGTGPARLPLLGELVTSVLSADLAQACTPLQLRRLLDLTLHLGLWQLWFSE